MGSPLLLSPRQLSGMGLSPPDPPPYARVLRPGRDDYGPPSPEPGESTIWGCNGAQRVQLAGGAFNSLLVHPSILPFEQLYRRLPEEGMFLDSVSPETPFAFELGAFRVPNSFTALLFDLRPDIYRFSGVDPGDTVPVEARRFSSILGFEITIDQHHVGNVLFQIDPVPIQTSPQAFTAPVNPGELPPAIAAALGLAPQSVFNIAQASSFANAAGAGESLLPQRPTRYGPLSVPFTLYARSGQTVQVRCVIFRPIPSPIAFIEYDIAGILMPEEWVDGMSECLKPMTNASSGPGSMGGGPR
jgi:hypothetical protein